MSFSISFFTKAACKNKLYGTIVVPRRATIVPHFSGLHFGIKNPFINSRIFGLVKKAAMLGGGFFAGGIGGFLSQIGGLFVYDKIAKFIGGIFRKKTKIPVPSSMGKTFFNQPQLTPSFSETETCLVLRSHGKSSPILLVYTMLFEGHP